MKPGRGKDGGPWAAMSALGTGAWGSGAWAVGPMASVPVILLCVTWRPWALKPEASSALCCAAASRPA